MREVKKTGETLQDFESEPQVTNILQGFAGFFTSLTPPLSLSPL